MQGNFPLRLMLFPTSLNFRKCLRGRLPCIGSFWRIPGLQRLQSCWKMVEKSVGSATKRRHGLKFIDSNAKLAMVCFDLCVCCRSILLTRPALVNKVYRRRKPHGECISRFTTRVGSERRNPVFSECRNPVLSQRNASFFWHKLYGTTQIIGYAQPLLVVDCICRFALRAQQGMGLGCAKGQ